jgi:hypothetical protein
MRKADRGTAAAAASSAASCSTTPAVFTARCRLWNHRSGLRGRVRLRIQADTGRLRPVETLELYSFMGSADGGEPFGRLLVKSGTIYGTTAFGGSSTGSCDIQGCGLVLEITPKVDSGLRSALIGGYEFDSVAERVVRVHSRRTINLEVVGNYLTIVLSKSLN